MKQFIACLLLGALLGIIPSPMTAQQNQNQEMEALKKRVSELEKQLQTVENVEKLDLQAKLAEANAKLANAEFGKFKTELRVDNDDRMRAWSYWFFGILGIAAVISGGAIWFWLKSLIADRVEKNLNGFKEAVEDQNVTKDQLRELEKALVVFMLDSIAHVRGEHSLPERIKALREEVLLQVLEDKKSDPAVRYKAIQILADRKSSRFVSHSLEFLNSAVNWEQYQPEVNTFNPRAYVHQLASTQMQEAYQGLKEFLNRLITEKPKQKDLFLEVTVAELVELSADLKMTDSVPILKRAIEHFKVGQVNPKVLERLIRFFNEFNAPEGLKEILGHRITDGMPNLEEKCLELLQKHDPEYVKKWRARETTENNA